MTGNEINIIAYNLYVTKEGFGRLLRELPGFTNLQIQIGVYAMNATGDGAMVPCSAAWRYNGTPQVMHCEKDASTDWRIVVRVNKGMGPDAIIGKAESKLLRRIYARITGSELLSESDADDNQETKEQERQLSESAQRDLAAQREAARQRAERLAAESGGEPQAAAKGDEA